MKKIILFVNKKSKPSIRSFGIRWIKKKNLKLMTM